ncbi:MAG: hypothetical protein ACYDH4_10780 [Candidatus Cryosericum sp.]
MDMSVSAEPSAEIHLGTALQALKAIHIHVFADLPEETAPPRNRLQVIAAMCENAFSDMGLKMDEESKS